MFSQENVALNLRRQTCSSSSSLWPECNAILLPPFPNIACPSQRLAVSKAIFWSSKCWKMYFKDCYVGFYLYVVLHLCFSSSWLPDEASHQVLIHHSSQVDISNNNNNKKDFNTVTSADITEYVFFSSSCSLCLGWRVESRVSSFQQKPRLEFQMAK